MPVTLFAPRRSELKVWKLSQLFFKDIIQY